jgi:hypothetical protein
MIRSIGRIPAERYTTYGVRRVFEDPEGDEFMPIERMPVPIGHVPIGVGY